ncbi:hydrolase [Salmonella enterica subsp. enterica]|uniref:Hydrolase n=1 Tax=Salmonella enterica I TaxID=59201 RepID=A0A447U7X9_SALET|nr:hydrolase [Salmonella enterica subsp. enterica]
MQAGQFVVSSVWEENAQVCVSLMAQAAGRGVSLLVLPEGILARDDIDLDLPIRAAQAAGWRVYDAASGRKRS